jgi:hypothetical protein
MQRFPFIDLSKSALHISGDNFARPQEHFNCIYSFWYNAPTLLPTGVGSGVGAFYIPKAVYRVKRAPEDGRICRPKHVDLF